MPANPTNKPVTRRMNEKFLEDPDHPEGMPYSTAQIQSNIAATAVTYLYHKDHPEGQVYNKVEVEAMKAKGWKDTRGPWPEDKDPEPATDFFKQTLERLRKQCDEKGITYSSRMGVPRLQELLKEHDALTT